MSRIDTCRQFVSSRAAFVRTAWSWPACCERPRLRLFHTAEAMPATVCELAWRASAVVTRAVYRLVHNRPSRLERLPRVGGGTEGRPSRRSKKKGLAMVMPPITKRALPLTWTGLPPAGSHQLAWRTHSITSSARASSACGTSRLSALAVFRLITSSYLVGACTGMSAGFSPLRMRST
jgi:hypothetical protein